MLEQLAVSERHRAWVDHVAQLFGGLDICAIELLVGKDGREYIIEVNDSALSLMGDSQEEDRRHIADLVTAKMQVRMWLKRCLFGKASTLIYGMVKDHGRVLNKDRSDDRVFAGDLKLETRVTWRP